MTQPTVQEIVEALDGPFYRHFLLADLSKRIKSEGIAPPDEMALVPVNTLKYWRALVDINPQDLAPRIEAVLAAAPKPEVKP